MATGDNAAVPYTLGRAPEETERLITRAQIVAASTRRLFEEAGMVAGMKVLDVGSGAGDVALLAAELVGPSGVVVGVDSNPAVLATARERVRAQGLSNVTFLEGDVHSVALEDDFDAVVGRYVLIWVRDPADVLRAAVRHLRSGGIVAFQESDFSIPLMALPPSPLVEQWARSTAENMRRVGMDLHMGLTLYRAFLDAGLPDPQLRLEASIGGGPDYSGYQRLADVMRSTLPNLVQRGVITAEEMEAAGIATVAERLRDEIVGQRGIIIHQPSVAAWARKP